MREEPRPGLRLLEDGSLTVCHMSAYGTCLWHVLMAGCTYVDTERTNPEVVTASGNLAVVDAHAPVCGSGDSAARLAAFHARPPMAPEVHS